MERNIITPDVTLTDGGYLDALIDALYDALYDAPIVAITTERDRNGEIQCEVTVRRFTEPRIGRVRYALVLDGDEYELRDYANKAEAVSAYRRFIRRCAADGVTWSASDVPNVTTRQPAST
jgi:hypothetical protein